MRVLKKLSNPFNLLKEIIRIVDLDLSYEYECMKNNVKMRMKDICYGVELSKIEPILLSEEHSMFKWCKKEEVEKYTCII